MDSGVAQWMDVARVAIEYSTRLLARETALVVTDTSAQNYPGWRDLADAIFAGARFVGAEPARIEFAARTLPDEELPKVVAQAMAGADVIYLATTSSAFHTRASQDALRAGARLLGIFGGEASSNTFGPGRGLALAARTREELDEWAILTSRLGELFEAGGTLHVTTAKGTDVECAIGEYEVHTMDGLYRGPGEGRFGSYTHFIPGQAGGGPTPFTTQGVFVVDASIVPIKRPLLAEPVTLRIKDGYVVDVAGGLAALEWKERAEALADPNAYFVAEFGFGCHPRARQPVGWPLEDERIYGGFHLGIGTNIVYGGSVKAKWHIDASCLAATASLNGKVFLEDGQYRL